jgi:hypothetical protein
MAHSNLPSSPASILFPSTRLACGMFDSVEIVRTPAPEVPQKLPQDQGNPLVDSVVRAIVHLNFNEAPQALRVLIGALTDYNFAAIQSKEDSNGNRPAA